MSDQCPICKLPTVNGVCPVAGKDGKAIIDFWHSQPRIYMHALIDAAIKHAQAEERERCAKVCRDGRQEGKGVAIKHYNIACNDNADEISAFDPTAHHEDAKVQRLIEAAEDVSKLMPTNLRPDTATERLRQALADIRRK